MSNDIYQYVAAIPCEYSDEVLIGLADIMGIEFDKEKYFSALNYDGDLNSINNVCIFHDPTNKDRFIIGELNADYNLVLVRCTQKEHEVIKKYMLDKTNESSLSIEFMSIFFYNLCIYFL